jgi:hypothetical protein
MPTVNEMIDTLEFAVLSEHVKLVQHFNLWWDDDHDGAPHVSTFRPYGNSGM